jgi:hypothetical protein
MNRDFTDWKLLLEVVVLLLIWEEYIPLKSVQCLFIKVHMIIVEYFILHAGGTIDIANTIFLFCGLSTSLRPGKSFISMGNIT